MTQPSDRLPDPARSLLRVQVAAVEADLARVATAPADSLAGLQASWRALVDLLALGSEPEYRQCPSCGGTGMRAATVCGHCWAPLTPLQSTESH